MLRRLVFLPLSLICLLLPLSLSVAAEPPAIRSLVTKPEILKRVVDNREVMSHAQLEDNEYSFYSVMLVHAAEERTRKILTDYKLYAKMVPYIHEADFDPKTSILKLKGGIWMFELSSVIQFQEKAPRWITYRIISGHFSGMTGDILFEPAGETAEKGTLVYMRGSQKSTHFPPKFVIERGAEIVFEFTAKRMRNYIETPSQEEKSQNDHGNHDTEVPRPRSHL